MNINLYSPFQQLLLPTRVLAINRLWVLPLFALSVTYSAKAQPAVKICTWKNGASGCYNIIHDDFGSSEVPGIANYADTMWYNRGLKFTFGAITSECEVRGSYVKAKQMIEQHGHEIINHSHTHSCPLFSSNCGSGPNTNYGWAEPGTSLKFNVEIDTSTASIARNTGYTPRFYIYPYDLFNEAANDYLKSRGYIGARNRPYNQAAASNFIPDAQNFFHVPLVVDIDPVTNLPINLNSRVDEAINNGTWVNRELHNVGNTGWGHVSESDYRAHLDYVKSKVDAGLLWVGTISEILTYRMQRMEYTPVASVNSNTITVNWNTAGNISIPNYLAPLQFKSPITLEVSIASYPCISNVTQNGNVVNDRFIKNKKLYINVYPHLGPVTITTASTSSTNIAVCPSQLPYTWSGQTYNAVGTYSVKLTNSKGCDSVATLNLSVKATSTSTTNKSVCSSQLPYSWNGQTYTTAGTYSVSLTNAIGCDSTATLNLAVKAASTSVTNTSVCSSQLPYSWNGGTYNTAGTYSVSFTSATGCDSIATLNLAVKTASTSTTNTFICSSLLPYSWNGHSYNAAGPYSVTLTNAAGCDSVATLNLFVMASSRSTTNTSVCSSQLPYSWNGHTYCAAGTYLVTLTSVAGCDSIAALNLAVKAASTSVTNTSVCSSQLPYSWNGGTYNTAGTYSVTLTSASGCDSIATLNLSVKAASTSTTNVAICSSQFPYSWNGRTYNAAGTYSVTLTNAIGCDSVATLNLTLTATSPNASTQTISFPVIAIKGWNAPDFAPGATATSGLPVTYTSSNTAVATIVAGKIHIVGIGSTNITASQTGNCSYHEAISVTRTLQVTKADQTINLPNLPSKRLKDPDFALNATSTSGLAVSYTSSNPSVAVIVNNMIHITGVGSAVITAQQVGNSYYNAATPVSRTLVVLKSNGSSRRGTNEVTGRELKQTSAQSQFYPNPVADKGILKFVSVDAGISRILILNQLGSVVMEMKQQVNQGSNFINISTAQLKPGAYYLQLLVNDQVYKTKFIKAE